ncbi:MBL fold metallo-hydrolase, partial [Methanoculleus chikugoensis]|uniref:MBL fold metallo-hydrolase n=1 Tax=Methanoculleus chikugoensis TaxID=118126 RepID=UPI0006D035C3
MPVRWIASNATYANSFVYENILIDAGVLPMMVEPYAAAIDTIVITHAHYDHIAHVKEIARLCGDAAVCIHQADAPRPHRRRPEPLDGLRGPLARDRPPRHRSCRRRPDREPPRHPHPPGHTPGGICLYAEAAKILFSGGDTVFTGGSFGRYDFPGGDRTALAASIERLSARHRGTLPATAS